MNLSTIPTDNLYKFCAIFGSISLYISVIGLPILLEDQFLQKQFSTEHQIAEVTAELEGTQNEIKVMQEIIKNYQNPKKDTSKLEVDYSNEEIKAMLRDLDDKSVTSRKMKADLDVYVEELEWIQFKIEKFNEIRLCLTIVSSILTFWGFHNWHKNQRIADQILKKQI